LDFRTGVPIEIQTYFDEAIDIHHIFPRTWCERNEIARQQYDSIINKTALSYQTNRIIGGNAPSVYLQKLREKEGINQTRQIEILRSHVINSDVITADDFQKFFNFRREALLKHIEKATGKRIQRQSQESLEADFDDSETDNGEN